MCLQGLLVCLSLPNRCSFQVTIHAETKGFLCTFHSFILVTGWPTMVNTMLCFTHKGESKKYICLTLKFNILFIVTNDLFLLEFYILAAVSPCQTCWAQRLRPSFPNFWIMTLERSKVKVRRVEDSRLIHVHWTNRLCSFYRVKPTLVGRRYLCSVCAFTPSYQQQFFAAKGS